MVVFENRERRNVNLSRTVIIYIPVHWKWSTTIETIPSHFHPLSFHLSERSSNTQYIVHHTQRKTQITQHTTKNTQHKTKNTQHTKHDTQHTTTHSILPINSTKQKADSNSEIESHDKKLIEIDTRREPRINLQT